MANKTRQDINAEIQDIIKSSPEATDTNKLQGIRHRELLTNILDYVDEQVAIASQAATGNFPFDWSTPSNAFSGYSNTEHTFAPGFWKFLHRDMTPRASLTASNPIRQKGSSTDVTLSYTAAPGTAAIASIAVDSSQVPVSPPTGTVSRTTGPNTDTTYDMVVKDAAGLQAQATATVSYLSKLFIFSSQENLEETKASSISALLVGQDGLLTNSRQATSSQNTQHPSNQYLYIAYPVALGGNPKIIINNLQDNSFTITTFNFTNSDNFTEQYYLLKGANLLSSAYQITIQ